MTILLGFKKPDDRRYSNKNSYFPKSGGTMSGDINLDGNDITGIANIPLTNTSVVSKRYLTDNYVSNSGGGGMFGNLGMNRNIFFNLANDSSLGSAINREYVHSTFLQKSGGTIFW